MQANGGKMLCKCAKYPFAGDAGHKKLKRDGTESLPHKIYAQTEVCLRSRDDVSPCEPGVWTKIYADRHGRAQSPSPTDSEQNKYFCTSAGTGFSLRPYMRTSLCKERHHPKTKATFFKVASVFIYGNEELF